MQVNLNPPEWEGYFTEQPTEMDSLESRLTTFEQLIIIKSLKEEKLTFAVSEFVSVNLGKEFVESPAVDLNILYEDMSSTIPLVFVLSTGSDPMKYIMELAKEKNKTDR